MIEKFFNIRYIFGKEQVWKAIDRVVDKGQKGYVVVADGVVVNTAQRLADYRKAIAAGLFAICDSGWVPLYLKKIYGMQREQYCGPMIFKDFVERRKHRMFFMGTNQQTLDGLRKELTKLNPDVSGMTFYELPFRSVEDFDYESIAQMLEEDGADIIWVALGAPKQDFFMQRLLPYLKRGVMIGVGAAFKFYSGTEEKRAPEWVRKAHLEFVYRILQDPKKQLARCYWIVRMLPHMFKEEKGKKRDADEVTAALYNYVESVKSKQKEPLVKATRKVLETISVYDEGHCRDKMNEYWLQVVDAALDALLATKAACIQDSHVHEEIDRFARQMVHLLDRESPECDMVLRKAEILGMG